MNTLEELISMYTDKYLESKYATESMEIISRIRETRSFRFLKNHINSIDAHLLNSIVLWILNVEINITTDEEWDILLFLYTQIIRYGHFVGTEIAPVLFTYNNIERCKQIIMVGAKYRRPLIFNNLDNLPPLMDLYPNINKFSTWYAYMHDILTNNKSFDIVCITHDNYELAKLLRNDLIYNRPCIRPCEPIQRDNTACLGKKCTYYRSMNPDKFPIIYSKEQIALYKNDKTTQILSLVQKPWNPSIHKYWPYSYREFVKTMLLISNRTKSHNLSKDALFCIIKLLDRNVFSENIISKLSAEDNQLSDDNLSLKGSFGKIYGICVVCGALTKNRCVTCRRQGYETRYCSTRCIEYDWDYHRKYHM
jgi:hypothetical protein